MNKKLHKHYKTKNKGRKPNNSRKISGFESFVLLNMKEKLPNLQNTLFLHKTFSVSL